MTNTAHKTDQTLEQSINKLNTILERGSTDFNKGYSTNTSTPILTFNDLRKLPFLKKYPLGEGMWGWRIPTGLEDGSEVMICEFEKGSILPLHKHDVWEKAIVTKGKCIVKLYPIKVDEETIVFDEGSIIIPPDTPHIFDFIQNTRLVVEFSHYERNQQ